MEEGGRDSSLRSLLRMTCWGLDGEVYGVVGEEVVCLGRDSSSRGLLRMTCWWSGLLRMTCWGLDGEVYGVVGEEVVCLGRDSSSASGLLRMTCWGLAGPPQKNDMLVVGPPQNDVSGVRGGGLWRSFPEACLPGPPCRGRRGLGGGGGCLCRSLFWRRRI